MSVFVGPPIENSDLWCAPARGTPGPSLTTDVDNTTTNTIYVNKNIVNGDCNFGNATANVWQETNVALGHVVQIAEERHSNAMTNMAL